MDAERCSLRCESDHESPWSQFIADTEGRFSPMQLSLPRNFSPLTPVAMAESSFCSSKFSPTSCFPPPAKKRAVRCVNHQKANGANSDEYHLAIEIDPIHNDASRVSSESGGTSYSSPVDHVWGYSFSPYNDHTTYDEDQNTNIHDVSPIYGRKSHLQQLVKIFRRKVRMWTHAPALIQLRYRSKERWMGRMGMRTSRLTKSNSKIV